MKKIGGNMAEKKTNAVRMLEKLGIKYEQISYEVDDNHVDALTVAKSAGLDIDIVYKTLVLKGADGNHYVCVINGADELDLKKAAKAFCVKNISMINVSDINKVTGYIRGGCSPIGMKYKFDTLIDIKAEKLEKIVVSAGKRGMQIELGVQDLLKVCEAKLADLSRE